MRAILLIKCFGLMSHHKITLVVNVNSWVRIIKKNHIIILDQIKVWLSYAKILTL